MRCPQPGEGLRLLDAKSQSMQKSLHSWEMGHRWRRSSVLDDQRSVQAVGKRPAVDDGDAGRHQADGQLGVPAAMDATDGGQLACQELKCDRGFHEVVELPPPGAVCCGAAGQFCLQAGRQGSIGRHHLVGQSAEGAPANRATAAETRRR